MSKWHLVFSCALLLSVITIGKASAQGLSLSVTDTTGRPLVFDANALFTEAEEKQKKGDFNAALTLFGKAAFEYNNAKLLSRYASTLMRMCQLHLLLKNYKAAEDMVLNVALKTYARLGSKTGEMNTYKQLGNIYFESNKLTESLWFFTQQGILAQRLANSAAYIESVLDIAKIKIKKKEFTLANADVNRAELLAQRAKTTKFKKAIAETRATIATRRGK